MTTYATDTFNGDGSTVEFTLTFEYIERDHVTVSRVVKATQKATVLTVIKTGTPTGDEFIWEADNKVKVGTAPATTDQLVVARDTPENDQIVKWADGSYIIATDLNTSDKQWLYGLQELEDKFSSLSTSAIKYFGAIDLTVDKPPASPVGGTFFVNTGAGTVLADWTGIGGDTVVGSESVIYNDFIDEWQIFKVPASQIGVVEVKSTAPITVDNTDTQRPVVGFSDAPSDAEQYVRQSPKAGDPLTWAKVAIPPGTIIANPLPTSPEPAAGQLGYNTGDNRLYIWVYNTAKPPVGSWVDASPIPPGSNMPTGGKGEDAIYENTTTIDEDYSIRATKNAGTFGPVTVNSTITVPSGSAWTIVGGGEGGGDLWTRSGTTISPKSSGDNLDDIGSITASAEIKAQGNSSGGGVIRASNERTSKKSAFIVEGLIESDGSVGSKKIKALFSNKGDLSLGTDANSDPKIELNYDGSIAAKGTIILNSSDPTKDTGTWIQNVGGVYTTRPTGSSDPAFACYQKGSITPSVNISADGSISAAGGLFRVYNTGLLELYNPTTSSSEDLIIGYTDFHGTKSLEFNVTSSGDIQARNTTITQISSERRLKEDISLIDPDVAWETVKTLPFYSYKFIGADQFTYGPMVDEVPAEMVLQPMEKNEEGVMVARSDEEGPLRTYDNGMLQGRLFVALQTALTRIEALEAKLTALSGPSTTDIQEGN